MKKKTLQQIADEQGIIRQAVWEKTKKGKAWYKAYQKAYQQTPKWKAMDVALWIYYLDMDLGCHCTQCNCIFEQLWAIREGLAE